MDWRPFLEPHGTQRELVVILHGFAGSPTTMQHVRHAVYECRPDADIFIPRLPFAGPFGRLCMRPAEDIAAALAEAIDEIWAERAGERNEGYESIILVGHSFGSVLVRNIALLAHGETARAPFAPTLARFRGGRPWAPFVTRIVLLAGMSGGWLTTSAMDWLTTVQWSVASLIGETLFNGKLTIFSLRKGAPYLVQTKLQWLALMRREHRPNLTLIQLLGTVDDLVSPDDNVDSTIDLENDASFFLLEVPQTGHRDAVEMERPNGPPDASGRYPMPEQNRWLQFTRALCLGTEDLKEFAIPRDHMADSLPPEPDQGILNVVFVIHGIRDRGYWTQKVAREIKKVAERDPHQDHKKYRSFTASYGYFAMAPFIFPWVRRRKVEWLMNHYTENALTIPTRTFRMSAIRTAHIW